MKWPLLLCAVLIWFNCGIESFRQGDLGDIPQHPSHLFNPPWLPLRAYVSRNGDEKLYWQYSRLVSGEAPDYDYLARERQGDFSKNRADVVSEIRQGSGPRMPYRDFAFEYPPLALGMILLPRLIVDSLAAYRLVYGFWVALLVLCTCALAIRYRKKMQPDSPISNSVSTWKPLTILVLALGPVLVARFDILPALLVIAALFSIAKDRNIRAGVMMGAAVMTKLYPLLLLAPWVAILWAQRRKRAAVLLSVSTLVTALMIAVPFLMISPGPFLRSTFLYGARPYEIESVVGSLAVLIGGKAVIFGSHGSFNAMTSELIEKCGSALLPLSIFLSALFLFQATRKSGLESSAEKQIQLVNGSCVALVLILLTSKVLSPQYLIWLLPLVAISPSKSVRRWAATAAVMTQIFYPFLFDFFSEGGSRWIALLVVARNGALAILAMVAIREATGPLDSLTSG